MKRYILFAFLAASVLNALPAAAQSPCHVAASLDDHRPPPNIACDPVAAQTITTGGETQSGQTGAATVTVSGGARLLSGSDNGSPVETYSGRTCQGLPPRLDFHFSRKVTNVTIFMAAETEFQGPIDITVSDNNGRSHVQRMTFGAGVGDVHIPVGFSTGAINHITVTTTSPTWHWEVGIIEYDDVTLCSNNPSPTPSPTPTRTDSDDIMVPPVPGSSPARASTDSRFYGDISAENLTRTARKFDGPITRDVDVTRVVGEVNDDGTLKYATELIDNKVISRYATLTIPTYDVDYSAGERDHILFNGIEIGSNGSKAYLQGYNKKWYPSEFQIPIELVRFGRRNPGSTPGPGRNEVEILVDEDGGGWRVAVGAPKIEFEAMAPVVMVHGNNSCGKFFAGHWTKSSCNGEPVDPDDPTFVQPFIDKKIPFDNSINMATDRVVVHADWLSTGGPTNKSIRRIAREWGSNHVHIIAHSKGGIDVRHMLTWMPSEDKDSDLGVLSLTTLSSPHLGSVGADYSVAVKDVSAVGLGLSDISTARKFYASLAPPDLGTRDLTVSKMAAFNRYNISRLPLSFKVDGERKQMYYFAISADANLDGSQEEGSVVEQYHPEKFLPTISGPEEKRGAGLVTSGILTEVYRMLGSVNQVKLVDRLLPTGQTIKVVQEFPEQCWFLTNDFLVPWSSAMAVVDEDKCRQAPVGPNRVRSQLPLIDYEQVMKNHATMSTATTANIVIEWIQRAQPIH